MSIWIWRVAQWDRTQIRVGPKKKDPTRSRGESVTLAKFDEALVVMFNIAGLFLEAAIEGFTGLSFKRQVSIHPCSSNFALTGQLGSHFRQYRLDT